MRAFWKDAEGIFETAQDASRCGLPDCDLAILIGRQGEVHMLEATGWALSGLLAEHGAQTAYRVRRERGQVLLEGRCDTQSCLLRSESPAVVARQLLAVQTTPVFPATLQLPQPEAITNRLGVPAAYGEVAA